jgi:CheY-like chemotaxis protein
MKKEPRGLIRVVVIEDNPADVGLLKMALDNADMHCELTVIADGAEAIAFSQQRGKYAGTPPPELIVLDLNLPKYDGPEILEAMRMNRAFDDVPVAVLTSSSSPHDRAKTEAFHISQYISKPPDLDEYLQLGVLLRDLLIANKSRA